MNETPTMIEVNTDQVRHILRNDLTIGGNDPVKRSVATLIRTGALDPTNFINRSVSDTQKAAELMSLHAYVLSTTRCVVAVITYELLKKYSAETIQRLAVLAHNAWVRQRDVPPLTAIH